MKLIISILYNDIYIYKYLPLKNLPQVSEVNVVPDEEIIICWSVISMLTSLLHLKDIFHADIPPTPKRIFITHMRALEPQETGVPIRVPSGLFHVPNGFT